MLYDLHLFGLSTLDVVDLIDFPVALTGREEGFKRLVDMYMYSVQYLANWLVVN